jgi:hypothetical protein
LGSFPILSFRSREVRGTNTSLRYDEMNQNKHHPMDVPRGRPENHVLPHIADHQRLTCD